MKSSSIKFGDLELMSESTLKIAQQAFDAFAEGWGSSDFQPFLEMLTDEFTFWYPYGKYRGKFSGREGKAKIIAKCRDHSEAVDCLSFSLPHHITRSDTTVMFEFECEGIIGGESYRGRLAIALDVSNDKISGFREYFGDVD
jgi:ketosteroid isomerase-like protein